MLTRPSTRIVLHLYFTVLRSAIDKSGTYVSFAKLQGTSKLLHALFLT